MNPFKNAAAIPKHEYVSALLDWAFGFAPWPVNAAYTGIKMADQRFGPRVYGGSGYDWLTKAIGNRFETEDSKEIREQLLQDASATTLKQRCMENSFLPAFGVCPI